MRSQRRKPVLPNVVLACMMLAVVYVLSYAPAVKWQRAHGRYVLVDGIEPTIDARTLPFYKPVDWLIDNTPLQRPLFWWAGVWGVKGFFESAHWARHDFPWIMPG